MSLRRLAGLLALSLLACRAESRKASAPGHGQDTESSASARVGGAASGSAELDASPDCGPDGRVWEGRLVGCLYEHGGCCYDTPESACRAAGCATEGCQILESSPAQLYCA